MVGQPEIQGIYNPVGTFYNIEDLEYQSLYQYFKPNPSLSGKSLVIDPPDGKIPYQAWAKALVVERADGSQARDDPPAQCLPQGVPRLGGAPAPWKIVQTPALTVVIYEAFTLWRQVFTDGRRLAAFRQNGVDADIWCGAFAKFDLRGEHELTAFSSPHLSGQCGSFGRGFSWQPLHEPLSP